jgi:hypothetical protein
MLFLFYIHPIFLLSSLFTLFLSSTFGNPSTTHSEGLSSPPYESYLPRYSSTLCSEVLIQNISFPIHFSEQLTRTFQMVYPVEHHFVKAYQFCDEYDIVNSDCQLIVEQIESIIGTKICWDFSQNKIMKFRLKQEKYLTFYFVNIMDLREWEREAQSVVGLVTESQSTFSDRDVLKEVRELGNLLIAAIRENQFEIITQRLFIERFSPYDDLLHPKFLAGLPSPSSPSASCEISLADPTTPYPMFSRPYALAQLALNARQQFETAQPWPHVIQDNLFHPQLLRCVAQEIQTRAENPEDASSPLWSLFEDKFQLKAGLASTKLMGPLVSSPIISASNPLLLALPSLQFLSLLLTHATLFFFCPSHLCYRLASCSMN